MAGGAAVVGLRRAEAGLRPLFEEVPPETSGIHWVHDNAASIEHYLPETMGPGCAFLDYDNDGWMDIYLVNSGPCDFYKPEKPIRNALYKNNRNGTFTDVSEASGILNANGTYGLGVLTADFGALDGELLVMREGRVAQIGAPRDIYGTPASRFVAEFIGTMNRLAGEVRDGAFVCAAGRLPWQGKPPARELLFRPEDAAIVAPGEAQLTGSVAAALFLGDRTRLSIAGFGTDQIIVETSGRHVFAIGEAIHLRIADGALLSL